MKTVRQVLRMLLLLCFYSKVYNSIPMTECDSDGHYLARHDTILGSPYDRTLEVLGERVEVRERRWQESRDGNTTLGLWIHDKVDRRVTFGWENSERETEIVSGYFTEDCNNIIVTSDGKKGWKIERISHQEAEILNRKDSMSDIPNPYEKEAGGGRLIFLTGPPGSGKSSTAAWLRDNAGYRLYNGDFFYAGLNPYITKYCDKHCRKFQPTLVGPGMQRRFSLLKRTRVLDWVEKENAEMTLRKELVMELLQERRKLGGDWVVPMILYPKDQETILSLIEPNIETLTIVMMLDPVLQRERLTAREGKESSYVEYCMEFRNAQDFPMDFDTKTTRVFRQTRENNIEQNSKMVQNVINEFSDVYLGKKMKVEEKLEVKKKIYRKESEEL